VTAAIIAGATPTRTSLKAKFAALYATTMSLLFSGRWSDRYALIRHHNATVVHHYEPSCNIRHFIQAEQTASSRAPAVFHPDPLATLPHPRSIAE
jgi:hypothetical protein